jgi:DNA-binding transcriptional regulator YhcF (GntR family)
MIKAMRQVINVNDIMVFFNKKERQSYKMMAEIKKYYHKLEFQPITIKDFAAYYNIEPEDIIEVMRSNDLLKTQNNEAKKQARTEQAATQKDTEDAIKQALLEKLERKENKTARFSCKPN